LLKTRIIPVILHRGHMAVKGKQFRSWRSIGSTVAQAEIYEARGVDELIFLDIDASPQGRGPDFELIAEFTGRCFSPITVGGGFREPSQFRLGLANGADKLCCCQGALWFPEHIRRAAEALGNQAITVCLESFDGNHHGFHNFGRWHRSDLPLVDAARRAVDLGAGEILLSAVDRDGMMEGYDLASIRAVSAAVSVPVVALGGAGEPLHFQQALDAGAHAVAASACFAFTELTPRIVAEYLAARGYPVRLDQ
jgi:cyclase